jgi:hypothetical protein
LAAAAGYVAATRVWLLRGVAAGVKCGKLELAVLEYVLEYIL